MHLNYLSLALIPAFGEGKKKDIPLPHNVTESKAGNMFVIGTHTIENRLFEALLNMLLHSAHSPHGFPSQLAEKVVVVGCMRRILMSGVICAQSGLLYCIVQYNYNL